MRSSWVPDMPAGTVSFTVAVPYSLAVWSPLLGEMVAEPEASPSVAVAVVAVSPWSKSRELSSMVASSPAVSGAGRWTPTLDCEVRCCWPPLSASTRALRST